MRKSSRTHPLTLDCKKLWVSNLIILLRDFTTYCLRRVHFILFSRLGCSSIQYSYVRGFDFDEIFGYGMQIFDVLIAPIEEVCPPPVFNLGRTPEQHEDERTTIEHWISLQLVVLWKRHTVNSTTIPKATNDQNHMELLWGRRPSSCGIGVHLELERYSECL